MVLFYSSNFDGIFLKFTPFNGTDLILSKNSFMFSFPGVSSKRKIKQVWTMSKPQTQIGTIWHIQNLFFFSLKRKLVEVERNWLSIHMAILSGSLTWHSILFLVDFYNHTYVEAHVLHVLQQGKVRICHLCTMLFSRFPISTIRSRCFSCRNA
jgi:hypothetical protein